MNTCSTIQPLRTSHVKASPSSSSLCMSWSTCIFITIIILQIVNVTSLMSQSTVSQQQRNKMTLFQQNKYRSDSLLDRSGGILYRTSILPSKKEWDIIYEEVMGILPLLQPETKSSIAQHRLGIALSTTSATVQLLRDPTSSIAKYINRIAGTTTSNDRYVLAPDIPVEIRSYEKKHANMNWHVDDVLYQPIPQIEVIWTILNTSNCRTMWQMDDATATIHSIETDPNSILCLRAGRTPHCVTPLQYGKRIILKCAYIPLGEGNKMTSTISTRQQFQSVQHNKKHRRK
jgi:hypothetical protein